jgi:hypothetical protein
MSLPEAFIGGFIIGALLVGCANSGQPTRSLQQWEAEYRSTQSKP